MRYLSHMTVWLDESLTWEIALDLLDIRANLAGGLGCEEIVDLFQLLVLVHRKVFRTVLESSGLSAFGFS